MASANERNAATSIKAGMQMHARRPISVASHFPEVQHRGQKTLLAASHAISIVGDGHCVIG